MTGPAVGDPEAGRVEPSRTWIGDAAGGIAILLALGLAWRLIIAYLLPGSGFQVDLVSFRYWAENLAQQGFAGFYERPFFHDYTPGYLYVLWLVGMVGQAVGSGHVGDLIKIPPILADLALAYLVWSMALELGAGRRAALVGAALVLVNPITWLDSVVWGQVDSVGVVVLLLALRELWRDHPERAAILAMLAALIKPQLGILIPIVAVVTIRRALRPRTGYGSEERPEQPPASGWRASLSWDRLGRGPIRIVTTGLAGLATAIVLCLPFGLSIPGLIAQVFKTAAGYPYLSVNAYNPWALVSQQGVDGRLNGIAVNRLWVCDSTITPSGPIDLRIGEWVIYQAPASTQTCSPGLMIGAVPAAVVGTVLFLAAAAVVLWLVARRSDRITMLVGLAVLSLAFFVLPTRVHERYLFPLVGIAAILAAVSLRWRIAYVLSAAATTANMYAVLTTLYPDNPGISDWLGIGGTLTSYWGVALAALTQLAVFAWTFVQLRDDALDDLAEGYVASGERETAAVMAAPTGWREPPDLAPRPAPSSLVVAAAPVPTAFPVPGALTPSRDSVPARRVPVWSLPESPLDMGPWAWFKARFRDRAVRPDRSRSLAGERGGRLDRLDVWVLAVLAISLLTVRLWRLSEPYQMHFDEVYHPRTTTEFLANWRYGLVPGTTGNIYEWTHPHLAKYAMAVGLIALGDDHVAATSRLGVPVTAAAIEPRWDQAAPGVDARKGDRLWIATGAELRAYDLATRDAVAVVPLAGVVAVAVDPTTHVLYAGTRDGEVESLDLEGFDDARRTGSEPDVALRPFLSLDAPLRTLVMSRGTDRLVAVTGPPGGVTSGVVVIDPELGERVGSATLAGVTAIADAAQGRIVVGTANGVAFLKPDTGTVDTTLGVGGAVMGVTSTRDLDSPDPLYASVSTPDGPEIVMIVAKSGEAPRVKDDPFALPGSSAGRLFYDVSSRMVHAEGTVPGSGEPTMYVIEPHGNAVYADARLPFSPAAVVLDDNQQYPSDDRQQLLALDPGGAVAGVPIGNHAFAWRVPGVIAGVLMALLLYVLARLLFRRRAIALLTAFLVLTDGMLFTQSRIGMNDAYVGLGIVGAYAVFAALWLNPGGSRRHWLGFWLGVPLIGVFLGFGLASKWVAAYAIGSLGILVLARSALGRLILLIGLVVATTALGYMAISVPEGQSGGNYLFLGIMVALTLVGVAANVMHPIAWTWEEQRLAIAAPSALGVLAILAGLAGGDLGAAWKIGRLEVTPLEVGFVGFLGTAAVYSIFVVAGRFGFGPMAVPPAPDDPASLLDPPQPAPRGWLNLGSGFGVPAVWLLVGLIVVPLALYVLSYVPWALFGSNQLVPGWPDGHTGKTLIQQTIEMYDYHNRLTAPHPASSPWWAWLLDLKPVWFYEEGFAGGTSASIYDAGNLVAWWLGVPAMAFVAWQAFKRRSAALALIAIAFATQWLSWARIDRAAFQYHYYTALPFLFLALGYFLAELWHGASRRTWALGRIAAAAAVMGPFALWLFHRPLCAIADVTSVNPGSQACPTLIPDATISLRAVTIAVVIGVGTLLLLRELLTLAEEAPEAGAGQGVLGGLGGRALRVGSIAGVTLGALVLATAAMPVAGGLQLASIPVEPIALVVTLALLPVATYVATARDAQRFVIGCLVAIGFWFVVWYPNFAALPLPSAIHNAYQGFLPTYLYPFQFAISKLDRSVAGPSLFAIGPAVMLVSVTIAALTVAYSAWSWRIALAERERDRRLVAGGATAAAD